MARSILIIDDSPEIHALLTVRLRGEAEKLYHAHDPKSGIALAHEHLPDLVLLDVNMPEQSGFAVCSELKGNAHTAQIPIIFLSGKLDQETKIAGLDLGALDYITKPFDAAELCARVRSALRVKELQDQLLALARIDELTRTWNRSYFETRLEQECAATQRHRRPFGLALIDLDHFKKINDTYGHPAGDAVLRSVASTLQGALRANDVVCRFGGEEFALILPDSGLAETKLVAERCRGTLSSMDVLLSATSSLHVTASFGIVTSDMVERAQAQLLVALADRALYVAKHNGRDRVEVAIPGH